MEQVILGSRLNMFVVFPLIAGIEVIREPLIRSVYERGAFTGRGHRQRFYSIILWQPVSAATYDTEPD